MSENIKLDPITGLEEKPRKSNAIKPAKTLGEELIESGIGSAKVEDEGYVDSMGLRIKNYAPNLGKQNSVVAAPPVALPHELREYGRYISRDLATNSLRPEFVEQSLSLMSQHQSRWEKAWRGSKRFATDLVGTVVSYIAYIVDFESHYGYITGQPHTPGNWFSNAIEDFQDYVRENNQIYRRDRHSAIDAGDFGWWAEGFADLGTTAGMLVDMLLFRGVGTLLKTASIYNRLAKGSKLLGKTQSSRQLWGIAKQSQALKRVSIGEDISYAMISRAGESAMEANGTYKQVYQELIDSGITKGQAKELATKAASEVYRYNWTLIGQDILQQRLFTGLLGKSNLLKDTRLGKWVNKKDTKYSRFKEAAKDQKGVKGWAKRRALVGYGVGADMISEGLEEMWQHVIQSDASNSAKLKAGLITGDEYIDFMTYLYDDEMWNAGIWGMAGAGMMQGGAKLISTSQKKIDALRTRDDLTNNEKKLEELKIRNQAEMRKAAMDKMVTIKEYYTKIFEATESGDQNLVQSLLNELAAETAMYDVLTGQDMGAEVSMEALGNNPVEALQALNQENEDFNVNEEQQKALEEGVKSYKENYKKSKKRFAKNLDTYNDNIAIAKFKTILENNLDLAKQNKEVYLEAVQKSEAELLELISPIVEQVLGKDTVLKLGEVNLKKVMSVLAKQSLYNNNVEQIDTLIGRVKEQLDRNVSYVRKADGKGLTKEEAEELNGYLSKLLLKKSYYQAEINALPKFDQKELPGEDISEENIDKLSKKFKEMFGANKISKSLNDSLRGLANAEYQVQKASEEYANFDVSIAESIQENNAKLAEKAAKKAKTTTAVDENGNVVNNNPQKNTDSEVSNIEENEQQTNRDPKADAKVSEESANVDEDTVNQSIDSFIASNNSYEERTKLTFTNGLAWKSANNRDYDSTDPVQVANDKALAALFEDPNADLSNIEIEYEIDLDYLIRLAEDSTKPKLYKDQLAALDSGNAVPLVGLLPVKIRFKDKTTNQYMTHAQGELTSYVHDGHNVSEIQEYFKKLGIEVNEDRARKFNHIFQEKIMEDAIDSTTILKSEILDNYRNNKPSITGTLKKVSRGHVYINKESGESSKFKYDTIDTLQTVDARNTKVYVGTVNGLVDHNGNVVPSNISTPNPGGIYVQDSKGNLFPVQTRFVTEEEASLVLKAFVSLIEDANTNGNIDTSLTLSKEALEEIQNSGLNIDYLKNEKGEVKLIEFINTIVFQGKATSGKGVKELRFKLVKGNGAIVVNGNTYTLEELNNDETFNKVVTMISQNKLRNIERNRLNNKEYKSEIFKILSSPFKFTPEGNGLVQPTITHNKNIKVATAPNADLQNKLERFGVKSDVISKLTQEEKADFATTKDADSLREKANILNKKYTKEVSEDSIELQTLEKELKRLEGDLASKQNALSILPATQERLDDIEKTKLKIEETKKTIEDVKGKKEITKVDNIEAKKAGIENLEKDIEDLQKRKKELQTSLIEKEKKATIKEIEWLTKTVKEWQVGLSGVSGGINKLLTGKEKSEKQKETLNGYKKELEEAKQHLESIQKDFFIPTYDNIFHAEERSYSITEIEVLENEIAQKQAELKTLKENVPTSTTKANEAEKTKVDKISKAIDILSKVKALGASFAGGVNFIPNKDLVEHTYFTLENAIVYKKGENSLRGAKIIKEGTKFYFAMSRPVGDKPGGNIGRAEAGVIGVELSPEIAQLPKNVLENLLQNLDTILESFLKNKIKYEYHSHSHGEYLLLDSLQKNSDNINNLVTSVITKTVKSLEKQREEILNQTASTSTTQSTQDQKADIEIGKVGNTKYEVKEDGVYYQGKKLDNPENKTNRQLIESDIKRRKKEDLNINIPINNYLTPSKSPKEALIKFREYLTDVLGWERMPIGYTKPNLTLTYKSLGIELEIPASIIQLGGSVSDINLQQQGGGSLNLLEVDIKDVINAKYDAELKALNESSTPVSETTRPEISELFEKNPQLANEVYEALGFDINALSYAERAKKYKEFGIKKSDGTEITEQDIEQNPTFYQNNTNQSTEKFIASEKTIRDLAARMSDRIGIPVKFESDRTKNYKGKLENGTAVINLAYATLDTPIHEILGHSIVRAIKNRSLNSEDSRSKLYENLLEELSINPKGKEVLDRVKRDYVYKERTFKNHYIGDGFTTETTKGEVINITKEEFEKAGKGELENRESNDYLDITTDTININGIIYTHTYGEDTREKFTKKELPKYTLEEQQEEAIVELLGLMTAEKLDNAKDGKLISLLKRLLKEMKAFMRSLINQKEVEIDKLPDNMTLGDIADLLAYSNSKLILPGNEVTYTIGDGLEFKTYAEINNHIKELSRQAAKYENVDLSKIEIDKEDIVLNRFLDSNKEYAQAREIIDTWKKINNIQYNPEEAYSRGQEFIHVHNAYGSTDTRTWLQNLIPNLEDLNKVNGVMEMSFLTYLQGKLPNHVTRNINEKAVIKIIAYPKSKDIAFASKVDNYTSSYSKELDGLQYFIDLSKVSKREQLAVNYTKSVRLLNINTIEPNIADTIDDVAHHNEYAINIADGNFRIEYGEETDYDIKKLIDSINSILDQKYGKLVKPEIGKIISEKYGKLKVTASKAFENKVVSEKLGVLDNFRTSKEAFNYIDKIKKEEGILDSIQPTQTNETLKESIDDVKNKIKPDYQYKTSGRVFKKQLADSFIQNLDKVNNGVNIDSFIKVGTNKIERNLGNVRLSDNITLFEKINNEWKQVQSFIKEKEYLEQALTNTKIAALKEVAKKYPRSLIRSEVRPYKSTNQKQNLFDVDELPFQLVGDNNLNPKQQLEEKLKKQQALQEFQEYIDNTGQSDIEGFKSYLADQGIGVENESVSVEDTAENNIAPEVEDLDVDISLPTNVEEVTFETPKVSDNITSTDNIEFDFNMGQDAFDMFNNTNTSEVTPTDSDNASISEKLSKDSEEYKDHENCKKKK